MRVPNKPSLPFVLVRTPRTDDTGKRIPVDMFMEKSENFDTTGYSFLRTKDGYEEWVPAKEIQLYLQNLH
jgi:hypothetical protein